MIKQGPVKYFACPRGLGSYPNTVCVPKVALVIIRLRKYNETQYLYFTNKHYQIKLIHYF